MNSRKKHNPKAAALASEKCPVCPDNPDLLLLRDAAADERQAIADYLDAARKTCFTELFLEVAEDEMKHYVMTMGLLATLDPVQAEEFKKVGLDMLVLDRAPANNWLATTKQMINNNVAANVPSKEDIENIQYLTKALNDELHAVNKYQTYMEKAKCESVKYLFCQLMNDEKEHVAEFTDALFCITEEPVTEVGFD